MTDNFKKVLISHNDLDGVGCRVLFEAAFPGSPVYCEGYDTVDRRIEKVLSEFGKDDNGIIFITDISPKEDRTIALLDEFDCAGDRRIMLVDHHATAADKLNTKPWAHFYDTCGTLSFFTVLLGLLEEPLAIAKHAQLATIVDDYDRWLHTMPVSVKMNNLLKLLGHDAFVKRCLQSQFPELLNPIEQDMLDVYQEQVDRYVGKAVDKGIVFGSNRFNAQGLVVFAENHQSAIGEEVRKRGMNVEYVAIVDVQDCKVSLRSVDPKFDVSEVAKTFGGGGHRAAAGFEFNKEDAMKFWIRVVTA